MFFGGDGEALLRPKRCKLHQEKEIHTFFNLRGIHMTRQLKCFKGLNIASRKDVPRCSAQRFNIGWTKRLMSSYEILQYPGFLCTRQRLLLKIWARIHFTHIISLFTGFIGTWCINLKRVLTRARGWVRYVGFLLSRTTTKARETPTGVAARQIFIPWVNYMPVRVTLFRTVRALEWYVTCHWHSFLSSCITTVYRT